MRSFEEHSRQLWWLLFGAAWCWAVIDGTVNAWSVATCGSLTCTLLVDFWLAKDTSPDDHDDWF